MRVFPLLMLFLSCTKEADPKQAATPPSSIALQAGEAPPTKTEQATTTSTAPQVESLPTITPCQTKPPAGLVRLVDVIPGVILDIKYATDDNFTGARLPGYEAADAWLLSVIPVLV